MWEVIILFAVGGFGYGQIELLYRGHTHWSMILVGGLCFVSLAWLDSRLPQRTALALRCLLGAFLVTGIELASGLVVNRWLGLGVWDYSNQWGNLWGQICPLFTLYWTVLCLPAFLLVRAMLRLLFWMRCRIWQMPGRA